MTKQFSKAWMIKVTEWVNFRQHSSSVQGVFFTYSEAREHLKELIDNLTDRKKNGEVFVDYTLTTYWDEESNCDHGASIIYTPIEMGAKEICVDYAIEPVQLFADWAKILNRPISIVKILDISETDATGKEIA